MNLADHLRQERDRDSAQKQAAREQIKQQAEQYAAGVGQFIKNILNNPENLMRACQQRAQEGHGNISIDLPDNLRGIDNLPAKVALNSPGLRQIFQELREFTGFGVALSTAGCLKLTWGMRGERVSGQNTTTPFTQVVFTLYKQKCDREREQKNQEILSQLDAAIGNFLTKNFDTIKTGCAEAVRKRQRFTLQVPDGYYATFRQYKFDLMFPEFNSVRKFEAETGLALTLRLNHEYKYFITFSW